MENTGSRKKLGFGLMRLPLTDSSDAASIDIEQSKKMVDVFLERGFTYFDTAWMYHSFKSEEAVKEILTGRYPRKAYQLATKLHADFFNSVKEREEIFNSQLKKTGVDYFDYYLLHDMTEDYYENKYKKFDCMKWLKEKKEAGLARHIGFSFHDSAEVLDKVLDECPEFEFVQLQINYLDWDSPKIQSGKCYETARKHGKKIIVMEPVKGGLLAALPYGAEALVNEAHPDWSKAEWAIKFAAGLEDVIMVLSGMSSLEQLEDNIGYMQNFEKLTEEERKILDKCAEIINSKIKIPCTGCNYCLDGCEKQIPIPSYFSLYNEAAKAENEELCVPKKKYGSMCGRLPNPGDCVECGACEIICPQNLPVRKLLKEVAEYFGK